MACTVVRRNITPPFHIIDKAADCSLYLVANVAHFLTGATDQQALLWVFSKDNSNPD